jgi:hypothetical protein
MDRSTDVLPAAVSTVSATSPYSSSAHEEHACQCSLSGGLHRLFAGRAEASADMRLYTKLSGSAKRACILDLETSVVATHILTLLSVSSFSENLTMTVSSFYSLVSQTSPLELQWTAASEQMMMLQGGAKGTCWISPWWRNRLTSGLEKTL